MARSSLILAVLLAAPILHAQQAAPGAAPAIPAPAKPAVQPAAPTVPATPPATTPATPPAAQTGGTAQKKGVDPSTVPLTSNETRALVDMIEGSIAQQHINYRIQHIDQYDTALVDFGKAESKDDWKRTQELKGYASVRLPNPKLIPEKVSSSMDNDMKRITAIKGVRAKLELFDYWEKMSNHDIRSLENAQKNMNDPKLKELADKMLKYYHARAELADTKTKEYKDKKDKK